LEDRVKSPQNIIVFFSDDHGQWALPAYGNRELRTPNLDLLAASGTVFENAFTPIPVCSPARACFFTGLMPSQHGVHDFVSAAPQFHGRNWLGDLDTLPRQLQRKGYQCGFAGKWHLGRDEIPQPGFDSWYAMSGEYPVAHSGTHTISDNGSLDRVSGNLTETITEGAVNFLRNRDRSTPFFLFVGYFATHSPWKGHPEHFVAPYRNCRFDDIPDDHKVFGDYHLANKEGPGTDADAIAEARAQYYGAIGHIDWGVGRILEELRGSGDDAVVVYTSDHGLCMGHHMIWGKGNATRPANMIEESIRIPIMVLDPCAPQRGMRRREKVDHLDLYQALGSVAGLAGEETDGIRRPGQDLSGLLSDRSEPWPKLTQFGEYGPLQMARGSRFKLIRRQDGQAELFDLVNDPGEAMSIIDTVEGQRQGEILSRQADEYFDSLDIRTTSRWNHQPEPTFNFFESWRPA
jgi:arylsulfatase A-like enzyme